MLHLALHSATKRQPPPMGNDQEDGQEEALAFARISNG